MSTLSWSPMPGDIVLTRNYGGDDSNTSPGYWNHCAVILRDDLVIQALREEDSVVVGSLNELITEVGFAVILRLKNVNQRVGLARSALKLEGASYRGIASIFNRLRKVSRGENCVSVVRKAFINAVGKDPGWKKPDDVFNDTRFTIVGKKNVELFMKNGVYVVRERTV